ncbi:MAG TPA: HlyD family type I secretion periplasmic adaptor subunit [Methylophilaceae bacterium]|nr:HlyD family type I secretion periplasmic adaptor subunit [Methylophilaceae bacterium]
MEEQEPLRAKTLLYWIIIILVALLLWAAFTQVDEVVRGEGRVTPSRQVQVIQSLDGGIVTDILVQEGQTVSIGDPLIQIDETRAISSFRENRSQYLSLLAKQSRLQALVNGTPFNPPPEVQKEAPAVYSQELALYNASKDTLASQMGIARDQVTQREKELVETKAKLEQAEKGYELSSRELAVTKPLEASGAVSEVDLLRLERDTSRLRGDRDQAKAQIERIKAAIAEAQGKIQEVEQTFKSQNGADLNETTAKLNGLKATSVALKDRVQQATLKSPVNGKVNRLFYNTVGGVIPPGKEVMEIVPTDDALVLETKIQPKDIAFVRLLQPATVKLTAYDYTIYGTLDAIVENVSPDSVVDDKGNAYYVVRVRTLRSSLGKQLPIIPGMVAQVDIMTGKKTILSYLLKPVLKAKSYAFTER